jgi:hypothetical protein
MTGVLAAAVVADFTTDFRASATALALGTIAALVAGVAAFLLARSEVTATTAIGKAVATFAQYVGAGLATVGLADLTEAAAVDFGNSILKIVIAGAFAALTTIAVNASEDTPAEPPDYLAGHRTDWDVVRAC